MTPRREQRIEACGPGEAKIRLAQGRKFHEVARLVELEAEAIPSSASVSAALAVLAGIAASDAACCAALRRRSRSGDHRDAADLLRLIAGGGSEAARRLNRLLALKDSAHYGVIHPKREALAASLRDAGSLIGFAEEVLRRG